jgi:hypothetical protein
MLVGGRPWLAAAFLNIAPNEAAHDLGRRRVLVRTQPLEQLFLARVDQDGKSSGTIFNGQMGLTLSNMPMCMILEYSTHDRKSPR